MRRVLGAGDLIMLAIGAVIGAGIFSSIGTAAAGEVRPDGEIIRYAAGPALILSFVLLGVVCGLAALCYAELASMIPQAGSAYAYSYATLGELVAWIIGWDLILEYAIGNIAVAVAWGGYFTSFLSGFGITMPGWLTHGYRAVQLSSDPAVRELMMTAPRLAGMPMLINLPAFAIVAFITWMLLLGVRESARANNVMVVVKLLVLGAVRRRRRRCTSIRPTTFRSRRTAGAASIRARRSCSSPTSASTRFRRRPRRRGIRSAICRSAFSAVSPSARSSTSSSASSRPGWCRTRSSRPPIRWPGRSTWPDCRRPAGSCRSARSSR